MMSNSDFIMISLSNPHFWKNGNALLKRFLPMQAVFRQESLIIREPGSYFN